MKSVLEHIESILPNELEKAQDSSGITHKVEKAQRNAYLHKKGIKPGVEYQLSLLFPDTIGDRADLRHIPNDYARSSLFTARSRSEKRATLTHEKLFHYNEHVCILYTGIELRAEDDELVWLQILSYGIKVNFGAPFVFSLKDLVRDVGWSKNGQNYERVRKCISRLKANEVLALNSKAYGKSGAISLIMNYETVGDGEGNPTEYRVWIDPNLILLFAGNTFTSHNWPIYRALTPVSRRLTDYVRSHKHPFPLPITKLRTMCVSSNTSITSWRQTVKRACKEIVNAGIALTAEIDDKDQICFICK